MVDIAFILAAIVAILMETNQEEEEMKSNPKKKPVNGNGTKKVKKPSPGMLGTGMARKAAEAALKRNRDLDKIK